MQFQDGTRENEFSEMDEEKKQFLEKVMSEGVVDEVVRMKQILIQFLRFLQASTTASSPILEAIDSLEKNKKNKSLPSTTPTEDELLDLFDELRDIVEQIDYALTFCQMNGLPFLLSAASAQVVPVSVRASCLSLLATVSQNNPKVQDMGFDCGVVEKLPQIYHSAGDGNIGLKAKSLQALSAFVRGHEKSEEKLYDCPDAVSAVRDGMAANGQIFRRAVFFLRSLLTDDSAIAEKCKTWDGCIEAVIVQAQDSEEVDIREICQGILLGLVNKGNRFSVAVFERAQQIKGAATKALERSRTDPNFKEEVTTWIGIMQAIKVQAEGGGGAAEGVGGAEGGGGGAAEGETLMLAANPNPNE